MNYLIYIVYIVLGIVVLLSIFQLIIMHPGIINKIKNQKQNNKTYSKEIFELGKKTMNDVKIGKFKKHLLLNDAPIYNSNDALEHYVDFVDNSTIYQKIISVKEKKFHG